MDKISDEKLVRLGRADASVLKAIVIDPAEVVTAAWVRLKCQYGCEGYGRYLVCPPHSPDHQQFRRVLECYRRALLLHFAPEAEVKAVMAELERRVFLLGAWKAFALGAGPCYFCSQCTAGKQPCRHPEKARPAMEACGIDVFSTVKKFGLPINVVTSSAQCPNFYALLLVD